MVRANAADAAGNGVDMTDNEADDFMREHDWAKWSDCREMVQSAYFAGQQSAEAKIAAKVAAERDRCAKVCAMLAGHTHATKEQRMALIAADDLIRAG